METEPIRRYMEPSDAATVAMLDLADGDRLIPLDTTTAWNWQQGAQAAWLGGGDGGWIAYNMRAADGRSFFSRLRHVRTGETRDLPLPTYSITDDGRIGLCLNFQRLRYCHPTIGYAIEGEAPRPPDAPDDDGLFAMDMESGATRLVLSLARLAAEEPDPNMEGAVHWITHPVPNPSGRRVAFLHRYARDVSTQLFWSFRLVTTDLEGRDVRVLGGRSSPYDPRRITAAELRGTRNQSWSHPYWRDDDHAMTWGVLEDGGHYLLYPDRARAEPAILGPDCLLRNGHYSFCPTDPNWMLSDTYPDALGVQTLFLYRMDTGIRYNVARFGTDPQLTTHLRCDLHPRWSRDGRMVCVDSAHRGARQMYLVDVSALTAAG